MLHFRLSRPALVAALFHLGACGPGPSEADGRATPPLRFQTIGGGEAHTCALSTSDRIWCWGGGSSEARTVDLPGGSRVSSFSAGGHHTCALGESGRAWCWGDGSAGQLGHGRLQDSEVPVRVDQGDIRFDVLEAGTAHTCGLTVAGEAYCWGDNWDGQVGNGEGGPGIAVTRPARVATDLRFDALTLGTWHTCALTTAGEAYCWGRNGRHLGTSEELIVDPRIVPEPKPVLGDHRFGVLDAGSYYTCGLSEGTLFCWGENLDAVLGANGGLPSSLPMTVEGVPAFLDFEVGLEINRSFVCGRTSDHSVVCWGNNRYGQVGTGALDETGWPPGRIAGSSEYRILGAGARHSCAIDADGRAWCWGEDASFQLGSSEPNVTCQPSFPVPCNRTPVRVDAPERAFSN